jgi:ribonuclease P protein component
MLAAKYRFHGYGALKFLFGHGKTYRFKSMSVRVAKNQRREHSRAAVVISKKVIKASPKRNQVRRRIYEALRLNWEHIEPGHDILISVYDPNFLELSHDDLVHELRSALRESRVWAASSTKNT